MPLDPAELELHAALRDVDPDALTPRAALDLVFRLKLLLDGGWTDTK